MALATYADLQSAVGTWLGRSDLTDSIPDFITMFEAVANRRLRTREMETSTSLTTSSGVATMPTDYLMVRSVTWNGSTTRELEYVEPTIFRAQFNTTDAGDPTYYTIEGTSFNARPVDDTTTITFRYYQTLTALSSSNTSNWLLAAHPDLYLFGTLVEANAFVRDPDGAILWLQRREQAFDEVQRLSNASKVASGASIKVYTSII